MSEVPLYLAVILDVEFDAAVVGFWIPDRQRRLRTVFSLRLIEFCITQLKAQGPT